MKTYPKDEVKAATLKYFNGDELATNAWIDKYALRDADGNILELTPDDMHRRMAAEFARISYLYDLGTDVPNVPMEEDPVYRSYFNRYYAEMAGFGRIVPQGSPMYGIGNGHAISSLGNCFVVDNSHDSYGGILLADQELVQLMKRRGGVGTDLSALRPYATHVSNAARTSTGAPTFMERFSNSTREVGQDGRRGALMETIHIAHPDSPGFIDKKSDLTKVTGANVSVRVSDEFMRAAIGDTEFELHWPVGSTAPTVTRKIRARELWDKIVHNAWAHAEPGIMFWDKIKSESPADCYPDFQTISTNPCVIGSTLIATADGRNAVPIKQLADEGMDVPVYSTDPETGQVQIKYGRNPRLTKRNAEVWRLTLDDGSMFVATPDHAVMLIDRSYKELRSLKPGDSIMPLYTFDSNGYRQVSRTGARMVGGNHRNRRQYRLIHEFNYGAVDAKTTAIHHANFDCKDDRPENLVLMRRDEHTALHAERMRGDKNPYHTFSITQKRVFASHPGKTNGKYIPVSNATLIENGKILFNLYGKLTKRMWLTHARSNGLPQHLGNNFRFGSFSNFKNQVAGNHKVVFVEMFGYADVYNITVDDNHNYNVITSHADDRYVVSSGITVKNCGEIPLCPYDSCRLLAINLFGFVRDPFTQDARFDWDLFESTVRTAAEMMDNMIDLEREKIDTILSKIDGDPEPDSIKRVERELWTKIRKKLLDGRRTGLGVTAEGDMLAALGLRYGSPEGVEFQEKVQRALAQTAYGKSVQLAKTRGAFPAWDLSLERDNPFIMRVMAGQSAETLDDYANTGRRNIAMLTIAPTGTTSVMTQTTSGIEPVFAPFYDRKRKVSVTPTVRDSIVNHPDKHPNMSVDDSGDAWEHYRVYHHKFVDWLNRSKYAGLPLDEFPKSEIDRIVGESPYAGSCAHEIDPSTKVRMQGRLQRWVDHSISVTINLPKTATEQQVSDLYALAWREGCKGMTVYRDGSRAGVLTVPGEEKTWGRNGTHIHHNPAPKRPKSLDCDIHHITALKEQWIVLVGLLHGEPYEVFAYRESNVKISPKFAKGRLVKAKSGMYNLEIPGLVEFDDITNKFFEKSENEALTRIISWGLRHGAGITFAVEQLNKSEDSIASFSKAIARALKKYIPDGSDPSNKRCPECGQESLIYNEGCLTCTNPDCGWSKCG